MSTKKTTLYKKKIFKTKCISWFKSCRKFYHFILSSSISDIIEFRRKYSNFLENLRKKKIYWKRVRVLEIQVKGYWHLHIAGTYLPKNLQSLWSHGSVNVKLWYDIVRLSQYLSKDFHNTSKLLSPSSKLLYRFDNNKQITLIKKTDSKFRIFINYLVSFFIQKPYF
jgi:hypothetical protein